MLQISQYAPLRTDDGGHAVTACHGRSRPVGRRGVTSPSGDGANSSPARGERPRRPRRRRPRPARPPAILRIADKGPAADRRLVPLMMTARPRSGRAGRPGSYWRGRAAARPLAPLRSAGVPGLATRAGARGARALPTFRTACPPSPPFSLSLPPSPLPARVLSLLPSLSLSLSLSTTLPPSPSLLPSTLF